ncbi:hypothetical protein [Anabaena azotica]|uniref:Uncharacterized protein n=1 Tax=Anabaena azotica FACHB-119 TaxID=947527 RepID=A0ABR8D815_9NOST|nr:hypothetical protein [Anabaena azotica]MBD2502402.1 hypothetical protein [Anabaena azotica FACHB-119]
MVAGITRAITSPNISPLPFIAPNAGRGVSIPKPIGYFLNRKYTGEQLPSQPIGPCLGADAQKIRDILLLAWQA